MRIPCSTYRLQFGNGFGFAEALEIVPYLRRLGVSDVYASPLLKAHSASTHGYDVTDPTQLDPKHGTREGFNAFSDRLREHDMGLLLDIVPNHMSATVENPWWRDVLVRGRGSKFAGYFDIDWEGGDGKLLLPVLGRPLAQALAAGELQLDGDEIAYYDNRFPTAPGSVHGEVEDVHARQHYRLDDWHLQATELNYRRFFDISELAGLRIECDDVFEAVHAFVFDLIVDGRVTGLRIDHVDGLRDPKAYLSRLQQRIADVTGDASGFYVVVEKILAHDEELAHEWQTNGTTGYEFLDAAEGALLEPQGAQMMVDIYRSFTGEARSWAEIVHECKLATMRNLFPGDLRSLARAAQAVDEVDDVDGYESALEYMTSALDVYRTYVDADGVKPSDKAVLERAFEVAKRNCDSDDEVAVAVVCQALLNDRSLAMRWQQFTGPVTAKSVEDTALYRFLPIPSRNEVGAEPGTPVHGIDEFHRRMQARLSFPGTLNALSTHDTKRNEEVRARINALTHHREDWELQLRRWSREYPAPDPVDAYLVFTTLVGAWPLSADRLRQYLEKAMREAKRHTSWTEPDEAYERRVERFAEQVRRSGIVSGLVHRISATAWQLSLGATLLKLTAPGVPDVYQGSEVEQRTLVDPDNRREVDFVQLSEMLDAPDMPDKLHVVSRALRLRRTHPRVFNEGVYEPLEVVGERAGDVIAYARHSADWVVVVVPRAPAGAEWGDTRVVLPVGAPATFVDQFSSLPVTDMSVSSLLGNRPPVALLLGAGAR